MSEKVHITKSGLKWMSWDGDTRQYVEDQRSNFTRCLRVACYIDSDVTLGDVFRAVAAHPELMKIVGDYSWCDMAAFHEEAVKPGKFTDLKYLLVSKYFEFDEHEGHEALDFGGIGPSEVDDPRTADQDGNMHWAIDFTPVNELASLHVRLSPTMDIFHDHKKIGSAPACFSLLEVLDAIYDEISFHGSPRSRDERGDELEAIVKSVKDGTAKLTPLDLIDPEVIQ